MKVSRYLTEGERIFLSTRFHVRALLGSFLMLLAAVVLAGVLVATVSPSGYREPAMIAAGGASGFFGLRFAWRFLKWRKRLYLITGSRLLTISGVFRRRVGSLPLVSITDLRYTRSLAGRLFRYGEVLVIAPGATRRINPLPRPQRFVTCAIEARIPRGKGGSEAEGQDVFVEPPPVAGVLPPTPTPEPRRAPPSPRDPSAAGGVLLDDRYLLSRRIAIGGMGRVYEGVDERLGRPVAIKLLREELADDQHFVERFRREARAAAALNHPNIASVFDYGESAGIPYIVMEMVDGRDLAEALHAEGALPARHATRIATEVLEALDHAHVSGVIHRDIKPGNVIVRADGRVKVTDFGIARATGASRLTATGLLLGSAHYVSPEQVSGEATTPQSDLYSVGVLLYEMLTGNPPFEGDSLLEVAQRHVVDGVPLPSDENSTVPGPLDEVVYKATERNPKKRYGSARDMVIALWGLEEDKRPDRHRSLRATRRLRSKREADTPPLPA